MWQLSKQLVINLQPEENSSPTMQSALFYNLTPNFTVIIRHLSLHRLLIERVFELGMFLSGRALSIKRLDAKFDVVVQKQGKYRHLITGG